jgi:carbonic anhydrase/acetyltransferase-like protein (isoleucine patch superfamily)
MSSLFPHLEKTSRLAPTVFVARGAVVLGDVVVGEQSSIWFNTVIRGDVNFIRIGSRTNVQDLCMIHVSGQYPTEIGDGVTIGHSVVVHSCKIGNNVLIGMGSVILDGAEIGDDVILGAGSLVTPRTIIPAGSKALGRPAKVIGQLTDAEKEKIHQSADRYVNLSTAYLRSNPR